MGKITGVVKFLAKIDTGKLHAYLFICVCCALALLANLVVQGVGAPALETGTSEEQQLLLLTAAVVAACAAGATFLALAIRQKQN